MPNTGGAGQIPDRPPVTVRTLLGSAELSNPAAELHRTGKGCSGLRHVLTIGTLSFRCQEHNLRRASRGRGSVPPVPGPKKLKGPAVGRYDPDAIGQRLEKKRKVLHLTVEYMAEAIGDFSKSGWTNRVDGAPHFRTAEISRAVLEFDKRLAEQGRPELPVGWPFIDEEFGREIERCLRGKKE